MRAPKAFVARLFATAAIVGAAALALAAPAPAFAGGWSGNTYVVDNDRDYRQNYDSQGVTVNIDKEGAVVDLTNAPEKYGSDYFNTARFMISADDVTIKGNPSKIYTNVFFEIAPDTAAPADGTFTVTLEDFVSLDSIESYNSDFTPFDTKHPVEVLYDGHCQIPRIMAFGDSAGERRDSPVTFKAVDNESTLSILHISFQGTSQHSDVVTSQHAVIFDGGTVNVREYVSAASIKLTGGCRMTGSLEYLVPGNVVQTGVMNDFVLSAEQIVIEDGSSFTVNEGTIAKDNLRVPSDIITNVVFGENREKYTGGYENPFPSSGTSIKVDNATIAIDLRSVNQKGEYVAAALGNVETITIANGSNVTVKQELQENEDRAAYLLAGAVGGRFKKIHIEDSVVKAEAVSGAGVGWSANAYALDGACDSGETTSIEIVDSTVTASSIFGSGIGNSSDCVTTWEGSPHPLVNVLISGEKSDVKAYSVYGGGIGGSFEKKFEVPDPSWILVGVGVTPPTGGDWGTEETVPIDSTGADSGATSAEGGKAARTLLAALANGIGTARASVSDGDAPASVTSDMVWDKGTLTVDAHAKVYAESGVVAIGMNKVETSQTIVQNTLSDVQEADSETIYLVSGDTATELGNVRTNYRSVAKTVDVAGEVSMRFGSGEGAVPMVNWNDADEQELYADTFSVQEGAFNRFWADRTYRLYGEVKMTRGSDGWLYVDADGVMPEDAKKEGLTYEWYLDGKLLEGYTGSYISSQGDGTYVCKVSSKSGLYTGSVTSNGITVSGNAESKLTAPELESVSTDSFTLKDPGDGKTYQYSIDFKNWYTERTFTGRDPNTSYTVVRRQVISEGEYGAVSMPLLVTTRAHDLLPGAESIRYDYVLETIGIATGVNVYADSDCTTEIKHGDVITDYIGKKLYLRYEDETGTGTDVVNVVPVGPRAGNPDLTDNVVTDKTDVSITITTESGVEYNYAKKGETPDKANPILGDGSSHTITGLDPNTEYVLYARKPASNGDGTAGSACFHSVEVTRSVTTKSSSPDAPTLDEGKVAVDESGKSFTYTVVVKNPIEDVDYEYSTDGTTWRDGETFASADYVVGAEATFYARAKETDTAEAGQPGKIEVTFEKIPGTASVELEGWTFDGGRLSHEPEWTSSTNPGDPVITYEVFEDDAWVTYGEDGSEQPVDSGNYRVKATFPEVADGMYAETVAYDEFTISPREITDRNYTVTLGDQLVYNGTYQRQQVKSVTIDNIEIPFSDTGLYASGVGKDADDYTLMLIDLDAYRGTSNFTWPDSNNPYIEVPFTIDPLPVELEWSDDPFVYNGKNQAPTAEVANLIDGDTCDVTVAVDGNHSFAGKYTAKATKLSNSNYTLDGGKSTSHNYEIITSTSGMSAATFNSGDYQTSDFTYGDTIIVKGTVKPTGEATSTRASIDYFEPSQNQVALYYGDVQISEGRYIEDDGAFELTYSTLARQVPVGDDVELTVAYVGTGSMAGVTASVKISLAKATLTPTGVTVADAGRAYDGTTALPEDATVDVSFEGAVAGDDVALVADDAAYISSNAGTMTVSAEAFSIARAAEDDASWAQWYTVGQSDGALTADDTAGISQAELTLVWDNYEGRAYADGKGNVTCNVTGALETDVASGAVVWEVTGADAESAAGEHTATFTLTKNDHENYRLANPDGAKLVYTVAKATRFTGEVSIDSWVFGAEAAEPMASITGGDYAEPEIAYKPAGASDDAYVADVPTAAGSYTVRAVWAATNNCEAVTATCDFEIVQSATDLSAGTTVTNGEGEKTSSFTYGEDIVVTVTPAATGEPVADGVATLAAAEPDQMTLWYRPADGGEDVLLAGPVDADSDGAYALAYDTAEKLVPTGSVTLVAKYEGTADMASAEHEVEVTIAAKRLTASVAAGDGGEIAKAYDGTTAASEGVALRLDGALEGDAVEAAAEAIAYDSKNVDAASEVVATGIALSGDDAGFYVVNETAATPAEIAPATVTVVAGAVEVPFGSGELPKVPLSYEGLANGETIESIASAGELTGLDTVIVSCDVLDSSTSAGTVAEVAVDLGELAARNYVFETASGTVTVLKAAPTVAEDDPALEQRLEAGATVADLTAPAVLGVDGEPIEGELTWYADEAMAEPLDADAALGAGARTLWWRFEPADANYEAVSGSAAVKVAEAGEPGPKPTEPPAEKPTEKPSGGDGLAETGDPTVLAAALLAAPGALALAASAALRRRR